MKTEVDLAQLAQAVSSAILQFAQPPTDLPKLEPEYTAEKPKKKRGRPKKIKLEPDMKESAVKEDFIAPSRKETFQIQHREGGGKYMKKKPFKKQLRINQWVDNLSIAKQDMFNKDGKKIVYPDHTAPRPPQEEVEYRCDVCSKKFHAFPSYIAGSVDGESQPQIRCFNCNSRR